MKCPNCSDEDAYQGILYSPECPNKLCKNFSQRRLDEVNLLPKNALKGFIEVPIDRLAIGDRVKIFWDSSHERIRYNGIYKVLKITYDETNLLHQIECEPLFETPWTNIKSYLFYREHITCCYTPENKTIAIPYFTFQLTLP